MKKKCPLCGDQALEEKQGDYRFEPPANVPGGTIVVRNAMWFACSRCGEEILSGGLSKALDAERDRRRGAMAPNASDNPAASSRAP